MLPEDLISGLAMQGKPVALSRGATHTTVLLNTLLQIFSSPGVVELTTQLLILINILWLPCVESINLGEILPSKIVAIPYTCGLSRPFFGAVAGDIALLVESLRNYIC